MESVVKGEFGRAIEKAYGKPSYEAVRELADNLHLMCDGVGPPFLARDFADLLLIPVFDADIEAEGVLTNGAGYQSLTEEPHRRSPEGFFAEREGGPRIVLRTLKQGDGLSTIRRRNFTLAHEIGHYVLRREVLGWQGFGSCDPEEEALCNVFASELLMPGFLIYTDLEKYGISPNAILRLQERYDVSLQALLCRITGIVSRVFGERVVAILWRKAETGLPVSSWVGPREFRRAILCDIGQTPIEAAFGTPQLRSGCCDLLLDGQRSRWNISALRLEGSSTVLSVLRQSRREFGREPARRRDPVYSWENFDSLAAQATLDPGPGCANIRRV